MQEITGVPPTQDPKTASLPPEDTAESPLGTRFVQQVKRHVAPEAGGVEVTYTPKPTWYQTGVERFKVVNSKDESIEAYVWDHAAERTRTDVVIGGEVSSLGAIWLDREQKLLGEFSISDRPDLPVEDRTHATLTPIDDQGIALWDEGQCPVLMLRTDSPSAISVTREGVNYITGILKAGHTNIARTEKVYKFVQAEYGAIRKPNPLETVRDHLSQLPPQGSSPIGQ